MTTLELVETPTHLEITEVPVQLELVQNVNEIEILENAQVSVNYFGGAGVDTDDLTIEGVGTTADPLRTTADVLLASRRLSEFDTQTAKNEARDNLGLNILDAGSF